jgi:cytochrome c551/c552
MKRVIVIILIASIGIFAFSCGGGNTNSGTPTGSDNTSNGNPSYDPHRGEGKFTKVDISATLDATMAEAGNKLYNVKCQSCHKLTEEKLVGPGWKGVTSRHAAEWIMNFITNTDDMLNKDPKAQAQLEICLVRMPNQNLTDEDARAIYEFQRRNDGVK